MNNSKGPTTLAGGVVELGLGGWGLRITGQLSLETRRCELAQNKETEPGGRGGQGHMLFEYLKHGHTLLQQGHQ